MADRDKTVEILVSDVGEMKIVLRPRLPFIAEGYRLQDGHIELFGQGEKLPLDVPEDLRAEVADIDQALLLEFGRTGAAPERETDILRH
jgi:hypothetical protein